MNENNKEIRFSHKIPENYPIYSVNGVFGAITPRGDFEMNFFFEHANVPEEQVMVYEDGELKPKEENLTEVMVSRDFKVGIVMTPQNAEAIGKWLVSMVEEFRDRQIKKE